MMKFDLNDQFYRINLNINNIPKIDVAFQTKLGEKPLVAFPHVLSMHGLEELSPHETILLTSLAIKSRF